MPVRPPTFRPITAVANAPRDPRPPASARGYDAAWRRVRNQHLAASPVCVLCEREGRSVPATVVDHIQPIVVAPHRRLDLTNLRSVCCDHHAQLTGNFRATGVNELRGLKS